MEYFLYLGLFIGGWTLSKIDSSQRVRPMVRRVIERTFIAGAQYGYEQTIKSIKDESGENRTVGFSVAASLLKKDKNDDV